jgi:hypothetical protein
MAKKKAAQAKRTRGGKVEPLPFDLLSFMQEPGIKIRQPRAAKKPSRAKRSPRRAQAARSNPAPDATRASVGVEDLRRIIWHAGTARQPRAAIVGGALALRGAVSEDTAAHAHEIGQTLWNHGPHQLRQEMASAVNELHGRRSRAAKRDLLDLLGSAIACLRDMGLVRVTEDHKVYLVGDALALFQEWPDMSRPEAEPELLVAPKRGGRLSKAMRRGR